ncbi:helix-turn-helix transcriptional regulator [Mycolicibacterium poriferae]|jgi:transcriptional regulator with XRE-family HTH domain|uniref:helix-turn-helix domain-containing protein n=1 Tax=Mycolicibacterium poriferae TaxID=39694 RepID=UPI0024BAEE46|nr:helix-turn-helix transcriptional regulator [Mycolicibacterium poriferae]
MSLTATQSSRTAARDLMFSLARARCERGMTQADVAAAMFTTKSYISMLESGKRTARLDLVMLYASIVGVEISVTQAVIA